MPIRYFRDVLISFALFTITAAIAEHDHYISLRLISSIETNEVFLKSFILYAVGFPVAASVLAMWLFVRNAGVQFENTPHLLLGLLSAAVMTYFLLLGKDEMWLATWYWLGNVLGDGKSLLGLVAYVLAFCLSGYAVHQWFRKRLGWNEFTSNLGV